ncbi:MAG: T9SS type A sorting domain-containing protein [Saprospiraceae bacterium]|nr:T9SS type A sorting domain-containing protein [Saprospiraceae bacterium]
MRATITCLLAFFALVTIPLFSQTSQDAVVKLAAAVDVVEPKVTLTWDNPAPSDLVLFRRDKDDLTWYALYQGTATTVSSFEDVFVSVGQTYEYGIQRLINGVYAFGYITVPVEAPVVDQRGTMSVFVEAALEAPLATELERLRLDLIGDGWQLVWHSVPNTSTVASIKSQIVDDYNSMGSNAVFLFGEIPVPYSGNTAWDGHSDHQGAWPADSYYGDIESADWTDNSVNNVTPSRTENDNVPGDGKFDVSTVPTHSELVVGRVDFSNLSEATFGTTRVELYRRYLDKNHNWRSKQYTVTEQALVDDNFGYFGGEAFAANGYRNGYPLVGVSNVVAGDFFNDTDDQSFLFAYGTGAGGYSSANGVGTSAQFASDTVNAVFTQLFGSYHGDWDYSPNPFMMSALASKGGILNCGWAGRPHWFTHHLGAGETIGYCYKETQNSCENPGYFGTSGECGAHITLLGDPSVRAQIVAPVSNVAASQNCNEVEITWAASTQTDVLGYHVYRSTSLNGYYERQSADPVGDLAFTDEFPESGTNFYLVKAVVREETPSGIFFNTSTGVSVNLNFVPALPPDINVPATVTLTCANPSYELDPCGPDVSCIIKGPGFMDLPPVTITQPGTYIVHVTSLVTGCTASEIMNVTLNNIPPAGPTATLGNINCAAQTVQLLGNSSPTGVTYAWAGPNNYTSNQQNPTVSMSGDYTLTATSTSNGCTSTTSVSVPSLAAPNASATGGTLTCGSPSVQLMGNSTTPNVDYDWTGPNGFTSNLQNPMVGVAGNYLLTVTSSNGCTATATAHVDQSGNLPQASPAASGELTCAMTQVTIMANPDMAGYTFAWTGPNGFTSAAQNPMVTAAGNYSVLVTNPATGCSATASATVNQTVNLPQASPMAQGVLTCIVTQVTIMANPNMAGFAYAWTGPAGLHLHRPKPVGDGSRSLYSVIVTNPTTGCTATYSATVTELVPPNINVDMPDIELTCASTSIEVDLSAVCNLPGITCKLNGQVVTGPVVISQSGTNFLEVFDNASGCLIDSEEFGVTQDFAVPDLTITGDLDLPCADDVTTLTASSSTQGAAFEWSGLGNNPTQTVPTGTYIVTATGQNGCETVETVEVTAPDQLTMQVIGTLDCDGTFNPSVIVDGGVAPYSYVFSPQPPFPPGTTFEITVTDFNGCTISANGTVDIPIPIIVGIDVTNETVAGANDGTATLTPSGGLPPFSYLWDNGQTTATATNFSPGFHICTITDAAGCQFMVTVEILAGLNATQDLPGLRRLALSPNPTSGRFELAISLENPMAVQVELLDVAGRTLSKTNLENVLEKSWQFDLTASPSGVYFCKITADGHMAVRKIVKVD